MAKLWFKAKKYGWGWYPSTWQGWAVLLGYLLIVAGFHSVFGTNPVVFVITIALTVLLIIICYKTGEKPRWRWGK
jgi:hypothetical protein